MEGGIAALIRTIMVLGFLVLTGCYDEGGSDDGGGSATTGDTGSAAGTDNGSGDSSDGGSGGADSEGNDQNPDSSDSDSSGDPDSIDARLYQVINQNQITGAPPVNRSLPAISDPAAHLGMELFFSKALGGDQDVACASCHHPALGGGDGLSLPVGIESDNPDLLGPGRTIDSAKPGGVQSVRVFLLGGQSNAVGYGGMNDLPTSPVDLQASQEDIDYYFSSQPWWGLVKLQPLSRFGPEITFGRYLADSLENQSNTRIAILKSAKGGTSLYADWEPGGDGTTEGDGPVYKTFQRIVNDGLIALGNRYPNASIQVEGMLWVQGEKDARASRHEAYEANLENFIADVRATYGDQLKFVISQLSDSQTEIASSMRNVVKQAQTSVATADPDNGLVDTDGFSILSDNLHFDSAAQQEIGRQAANIMLGLIPPDVDQASGVETIANVPRNAPTTFNIALWDDFLFHDGRVESLTKEPGMGGTSGGIRTPDSPFEVEDPLAGPDLVAAQARFPVTSIEKMRGRNLVVGADNESVRTHLAKRLGGVLGELQNPDSDGIPGPDWPQRFEAVFGAAREGEALTTYERIAFAIAAYESSQVFVDTPWQAYVQGDKDALTDSQKKGALLFYRSVENGGAGCAGCHSGDFFTDEQFHNIAMIQVGPGKGDGEDGTDDFGRFRETNAEEDRYAFRTPTLLNVEVTGPFGHAGAYDDLESVIRHHLNPQEAIADYFASAGTWCNAMNQYSGVLDCDALMPSAEDNALKALATLQADQAEGRSTLVNAELSISEVADLVAFMKALTDPCLKDASCLGQWIPDTSTSGASGLQLNATDRNGHPLTTN
jgi:cytochrome c peroxidase